METVTTEEQEMTVTGLDGGQTKVVATVVKTDHGVVDEHGNPKISVEIKIPAVTLALTPGEAE